MEMRQFYPKRSPPSARTTPLTLNMMQLGMQCNVTAAVWVQLLLCAKHEQWIFIYRDNWSAHYVWTSIWWQSCSMLSLPKLICWLSNCSQKNIFQCWLVLPGEWRKLHNEELSDLYSLPNIVRVVKSRRMRWAGHVACMGEGRGVPTVLVGKPEGKRPSSHWP